MKPKSKLQLLCAAAVSFLLVNAVDIQLTPTTNQLTLNIGTQAQARRGGGRSGGGSFRSAPSRSRSSPSRSSGSDSNYGGGGYSSGGTTIYVGPRYSYGGYYYSPISLIVLVIILAILVAAIAYAIAISKQKAISAGTTETYINTGNRELDNNIVTISKIQVGLLAQARSIQTQLSQLSLNIATDTPEGLSELLQESALALLRTPENWTHVSATSKTVRSRDEAEAIFNKFSIEERGKFSGETLTNVNGKVRQNQHDSNSDSEPGSYIVVTLLIGTEDDRPLFGNVYSTNELKQALERIAATPPEYLSKFELLWTPQVETESLTYDEMLTEYASLMPIA
ncbi:DUF1517 domain-containing protein [Microseira sp. BLCC-F43]|jgi:uncharacterized membrane protein|uniref:DUF1517 domain-containing protein n=1 Tax=Microseira sp. BLCC-F43 TaxID=3153602 RepID=UPI0035B98EBA